MVNPRPARNLEWVTGIFLGRLGGLGDFSPNALGNCDYHEGKATYGGLLLDEFP